MSKISKLDQVLIIKKIDKETINLQITDNEMLMSVVGQFDQNLKDLEKITNTKIFFQCSINLPFFSLIYVVQKN